MYQSLPVFAFYRSVLLQAKITTLDVSCIKYLNNRLFVKPFYVWGWNGMNTVPPEQQHNGVLLPFHMQIRLFISGRNHSRGGVLDGGVGIIQETAHLCDDFWIIFSSRGYKGNFASRVIRYDIDIGNTGNRMFRGYAIVAKTPEHVEIYEAKTYQKPPESFNYQLQAEMDLLLLTSSLNIGEDE